MTLWSTSVKYFAIFTIVFALFRINLATAKCADIVLAESSDLESEEDEFPTCGVNQFQCQNHECIPSNRLCDGRADCPDQSDETFSQCTRSGLTCPELAFRCDYGACVHENAPCNGVKDCLDNSDELLPECARPPRHKSSTALCIVCQVQRNHSRHYSRRSHERITVPRPRISTPIIDKPRSSRSSRPLRVPPILTRSAASSSCVVPPQPLNGQWRLDRRFCKENQDCRVLQGVALPPDSQLIYSCAEGFMLSGSGDVYCDDGGNWSSIPVCVVTTCTPLQSISSAVTCSRFGDRVNCTSSVLPFTRARVSCRRNYGLEGTFSEGFEQDTQCNENGQWEPEPIRCTPVCGVVNTPGGRSTALNGVPPDSGPFPWHVNLWREIDTPRGPEREFRCSATIVQTNFVVTARHCVIDERTGLAETPNRLRVTSGQVAADGSSLGQTSASTGLKVKNVYRYCESFGETQGYDSDIALVELEDPFVFTDEVLPACLDVSSTRERDFVPGTIGRIDGFGRRSASTPSPILQNVQATYVSNGNCGIPKNTSRGAAPSIRSDQFCAVYSNDTTICNWDTGGGFFSKKNGLWYLRGTYIRDLGSGLAVQRACGENPYSLYSKVSPYMPWIQDVLFQLRRYKTYPVCRSELKGIPNIISTGISTSNNPIPGTVPTEPTRVQSGTGTGISPSNPIRGTIPTEPTRVQSAAGTGTSPSNPSRWTVPTDRTRVQSATGTGTSPSNPKRWTVPTERTRVRDATGTGTSPSNPIREGTPTGQTGMQSATGSETSPTNPTPMTVPIERTGIRSETTTEMLPTDPTSRAEETTIPSITTTEMLPTDPTPTPTPVPVESRTGSSNGESSCLVPPQPNNGEWKLHPDLCKDGNCDIPEGASLGPGSQLVYSCNRGYRLAGNPNVLCGAKGQWFSIPQCIEITCDSLDSVSRMVTCYESFNWARCNSTARPGTRAVMSCRVGYTEDTNSLKTGDKTVVCNENGQWEPNPLKCLPVCGMKNARVTPTVIDGKIADITDFPWHATLYKQKNATQGTMKFICGATIIQDNLLLTAAHCVYDENFKAIETPEKFGVAAGNKYRDYDSPLHTRRFVQKSMVKNIYVPCDYYGLEGNYASDIAIIELWEPFHLSDILLPACLDIMGNSEWILVDGKEGQFAGFGRTKKGESSGILLAATIPYVSWSKCRMSQKAGGNKNLIVQDKFCGGNTQGMAVCTGDSGGGLTFDNSEVSNVMGVLSVNLNADTDTGERTCDPNSFSLYTKVSNHMAWIRDVMSHLERGKTYPSCGSQ